MKKIIIVGDLGFTSEQMDRILKCGEVTQIEVPDTEALWLDEVSGYDILISDGDYLKDGVSKLENIFVTYPFIELGNFDSDKLAERGVYVANSQGSNKNSIVEWAIFATLGLFRNFPSTLNVTEDIPLVFTESLANKKALMIGKGDIGMKIGDVLESLEMEVSYFGRGEDLKAKSADADLVVNGLNCNPTSENLLDEEFFINLKKGAHYVSFVRQYTYDLDGMIKSLDAGILGGAAIDCDPEKPGDTKNSFYTKIVNHPKILATPHIAFSTKQAISNGGENVVDNVEHFVNGEMPRLVVKKAD